MKKFFEKYCNHNLPFHIFSLCAIILIAASFVVPPLGVIDGSVLAAVGEIFAFAALGAVYKAIDNGTDAKITKGDVSITINNDNDNDNNN